MSQLQVPLPEDNGVFIQSIAFGPESVEVTYIERRHADRPITRIDTLVVPAAMVPEELADVTDSIQQLIDRALELDRSPPERIRGPR